MMRHHRRACLALVAAAVLGGCAADDAAPSSSTAATSGSSSSTTARSSTSPPASSTVPATHGVPVTDALARDVTGEVTLTGYLVIDNGSPRLCELLLELTPPACGGVSISVAGPVDSASLLDSGAGVRWSPFPVDLTGSFSGSKLVAAGPSPQLAAPAVP
jgi:hypothetical protein